MNDYYEALRAAGVVRKARKQDKELDTYLSNKKSKKIVVKVAVMDAVKEHRVEFTSKVKADKYIGSLKDQTPYFTFIGVEHL